MLLPGYFQNVMCKVFKAGLPPGRCPESESAPSTLWCMKKGDLNLSYNDDLNPVGEGGHLRSVWAKLILGGSSTILEL